ncbi:protein transport protein Sec39 [Purpureocillium lavendulum]|uniref:Protein transport protein Sec39 n=1 Tax=Purpureocillium lavendulum TaxID=1247861 RepID=A0AB34G0M0_9HYPO|nr:protein transport protein Sec39 [Purpureocillium lavendulum]
MAQGYAIFIGLVVIAILCAASWFLAPKGENQVSVPSPSPCRPPLVMPLRRTLRQLALQTNSMLTVERSHRLWRSSLILSIVSCYLMWAITFLAQLHPLIVPKRSDLREQFLER